MVLSAQPAILWYWFYWQFFPKLTLTFFVIFPVIFITGVIILIFSAIIVSRIFLSVINIIHKPKEGVFKRSRLDKDYCYWGMRGMVKKWPIWIARQLNVPIFEKIALKILGVKISTGNSLHGGWVDCEFLEFGKNNIIGQGSVIMSNLIIKDRLIIKKVVFKDNIIIGAHSVVLPGTLIGSNTILDGITLTKVNQKLEADSVYSGIPAKKIMENRPFNIEEKLKLEKKIFEEPSEVPFDENSTRTEGHTLSVPFGFYVGAGWITVGCSFILPAFLFYFFIFGYLVPTFLTVPLTFELLFNLNTCIAMFLTPLILIGLYLMHIFFVALITRWFYAYADARGPAQGVFDRNLSESSSVLDYYHLRSFLLKYPVFAVIRSPFPWLLNWELRFIGSNKIGKGTVLEECYIHSHINYGKNCYVGTFAHNTNHLVDGVYGDENLTFFGAEVEDNCVFSALMGGLPGLEMGKNSTMLPMCSTIKYDRLGEDGIYSSFPARRLTKEQIIDILGGEYDGE